MDNNSLLQSASDVADVDRSILKISIVIFAAVLFEGLAGYFLEEGKLIYGAVFTIIFLVIFILQNLFIKGFDKLFFAILLESIAFALPFYQNFSGLFVIAVFVLTVLLFKASFDSRKELEATMKIRFFRVSRLSLNLVAPALVLFIIVMFVMKGGLFSEEGVNILLRPLTPLVMRYYPTFSPSVPMRELLNNIVVSNLGDKEVQDLNKLPLWAQNQLITKSVDQLTEKVEDIIGSKIDLGKPISANIYDTLRFKYIDLTPSSKVFLWSVSLILIYSLVRSFIPFIHAPIALLAFIVYEILLAFNFAVVQLESRSREVIILK